MQAWLIHSCRPGLSFKIKNDYNTSRISCNFFLLFFIIFDIFHEILNFCTIFYTYHDFLDIIRKNEYDNQCFFKICRSTTEKRRIPMQPSSNNCYDTGLREECGVFGIYDLDGADVSPSIYYAFPPCSTEDRSPAELPISDTSVQRAM